MFRLFWAVMILVVTCVLSAMSGTTSANLEESIAYIKEQLENGKKYAIILIGMQRGRGIYFSEHSNPHDIIRDQLHLLGAFASTENVWFIQVRYNPSELGSTFPELNAQGLEFEHYAETVLNNSQLFSTLNSINYSTEEAGLHRVVTPAKEFLKERGVKDLFIVGCWDQECVIDAARNGAEEGFSVTVDRDLNVLYHNRSRAPSFSSPGIPYEKQAENADAAWWELKQEHPEVNVIGRAPKPCQES